MAADNLEETTALPWPTLVDMCLDRAEVDPERRSFVFLEDGETESDSLTLGQLDRQAKAIATRLSKSTAAGSRALLAYPPGLEFLCAFMGCLYAGVIAVPIAPIERGRDTARIRHLRSLMESAGPEALLSTASAMPGITDIIGALDVRTGLTLMSTDETDLDLAEAWSRPETESDDVAYLQYSSGSTGAPKGVVLTHRNVLSNLALIHENGARGEDDGQPGPPVVLWLPMFHDMGLVNGLLQPLFAGYDATLMSPLTFVQRPVTWLRTISRLGRALSVAPNFAFDLCVRRISPAQRKELDLSGWELAAVGAEPVRAETLERFSESFAESGFRREAFFPCYGLAESTVMVSGGPAGEGPVIRGFDKEALARGRVRPLAAEAGGVLLVGCGQIQPTTTVVLLDPVTGELCGPDQVGEILVAGPAVGAGYWNEPEQTEQIFRAVVPGHAAEPFLRTGDLGFICQGQLFVTGRRKEMVIIDGLNYYPHDIEATVAASHPLTQSTRSCAFSVDDGHRERLVVLCEVRRGVPGLAGAIRDAISAAHRVPVQDVVLLKLGSLSLTSSGKIQRLICRERYQAGDFDADRLSEETADTRAAAGRMESDHVE